ncbi:hypothetical protein ACLB2K_059744 [Fragaria x ananassa]
MEGKDMITSTLKGEALILRAAGQAYVSDAEASSRRSSRTGAQFNHQRIENIDIPLHLNELAGRRAPSPKRLTGDSQHQQGANQDAIAHLLTRLMELEQKIVQQSAPRIENRLFNARPDPFTSRIKRTFPINFKAPKMLVYIGNSDPYAHIYSFQKVTNGREYYDATQCQLFSETLEGEAMSWFFKQPPNSVDSFKELRHAFLSRFILKAEGGQGAEGLFKVKQRQGESHSARLSIDGSQ